MIPFEFGKVRKNFFLAQIVMVFMACLPFSVHAQDFSNAEGEMSIPSPQNPDEQMKINFIFGDLPEQLSAEELTKHEENLEALQKATDSKLPIVVLEEEGNVLALPQELSRGQKVLHVSLPASIKKFGREVYVKPTTGDITSGIIFCTIRGVTTSLIWYSSANISPVLATTMTAWMVGLTFTLSTFHITIDNALLYGIKDRDSKVGKMWSRLLLGIRTLALDLTLGNLTNVAGGMQKTVLQSTVDNLALTVFNNTYNTQRNVMLKDRRDLKLTYNFLTRPFLYTLRGFQDLNKWPALFSIGAYPVTHSILASVSLYAGLFVLNVTAGDTVIKVLDKIHARATSGIKALGVWISGGDANSCERSLNSNSDENLGYVDPRARDSFELLSA